MTNNKQKVGLVEWRFGALWVLKLKSDWRPTNDADPEVPWWYRLPIPGKFCDVVQYPNIRWKGHPPKPGQVKR